ncbi:DUF1109 domain-containing protein [Bifidobacterium leontopitheci]|uniref:DUF1109 domain-containing protein n=1 Tax=Bifidobacterium leontopitheci TaxID=2650774 RepID=UPI001264D425|nr:DUF1109 domain-containing protein [Bifidobacterium leontopitheci]
MPRVLAAVLGLLALAVSALAVVRAVAPQAIGPVAAVPVRALLAGAVAGGVVTIIVVIVARTMVRRASVTGRATGVGGGAIVAAVCAFMLTLGGLLVSNLFPDGIITPPTRDEAPTASADTMRSGFEKALSEASGESSGSSGSSDSNGESAASCSSDVNGGGWTSQSVSGYPGVSAIEICKSGRVAFVTFESTLAASMYRAPAQAKIAETLQDYSDDPRAQGDWRLLNGDKWMAFGPKAVIDKLHEQWGGTEGTID